MARGAQGARAAGYADLGEGNRGDENEGEETLHSIYGGLRVRLRALVVYLFLVQEGSWMIIKKEASAGAPEPA